MEDESKVKNELAALKAKFRRIEELETECHECAMAMAEAAEQSKEAKKAYEAAVSRLRNAVRDAKNGQQELPFGEEQPAEAWRAVTLEELEISGKLAASLTEAGLTTLGAIADYTANGGALTDIDGIGPKAAEKIDAATQDWWERHPGEADAYFASEGDGNKAGEAAAGPVEAGD